MKNQQKRVGGNGVEALEGRRMLAVDQPYAVPTSPRVEINQNAGWRFALNPSGSPQTISAGNVGSFGTAVNLPHTWNNIDAATQNYQQGNGWYLKNINVDASLSGKRLLLDFEGAMSVTSLFIDGQQVDYKPASSAVDSHNGGFAEFMFDVTSRLTPGQHTIAVRVHNQPGQNLDVAPSNSGDYSRQGGIYRDVSLLALPQTRLSPLENVQHTTNAGTNTAPNNVQITGDVATPIAGPGVYFKHSPVQVGSTSATLNIKTVYENNSNSNRSLNVTSYLVDASGTVRAEVTTNKPLASSSTGGVLNQTTTLNNPRLWNGRIDPYLYTLYVEVRDATTNALVDFQSKKVGIRSFTINANANNNPNVAPFLLNGQPYALVGANAHQDTGRRNANGDPIGWAQSDAGIRADVDLLMAAGSTVVRTSHYQHNKAFYDYCDQVGLLVYTEIAINGTTRDNTTFLTNAQDMYQEMTRQTQLNPSVFAWGFANETTDNSPGVHNTFTQLQTIGRSVDPARKTAVAQYGGHHSSSDDSDGIADIKGTHRYDGWYIGWEGTGGVQNVINSYPSQPIAITEYGAGGSAYHFADNPIIPVHLTPNGGVDTNYHPANGQALVVAMQTTQYEPLNNLWARIVWQAFDHGSSGKSEGDQNGVNDKGLTTRDRTLKDAYHYYSAIWNDPTRNYANRKIIQLADTNWTVRNSSAAKITVYSNIGAPTLNLNGTSLGVMSPLQVSLPGGTKTVKNVYVMNVTLPAGVNSVTASRTWTDGLTYSSQGAFAHYNSTQFGQGVAVASGVAVNTTFNYSPVYKTTSNPFNVPLANGLYNVRINAPTGGTNNLSLEGQTAAIDSNGLGAADTFYARVNVTDGNLTIAGAPGAFNARVNTIDITRVDLAAPTVAGVVNGGETQRSKVNSLGVTFNEPVTLGNAAISLGLKNPNGVGYAATFSVTASNPSNDGMTYLLGLTDGSSFNSLGDGVYDLKVDSSKVSDLAGNALAANYSLTFHRLFGDQNGDRGVDSVDSLKFRAAQGKTSTDEGFIAYFDFNNDNMVDSIDSLQFRRRQGTVLSY
ncbi:MAG TPA: glycoside hydrolase family 2 TIM barrel-domain containing protein [Tepidisphaeraceae bacterium]